MATFTDAPIQTLSAGPNPQVYSSGGLLVGIASVTLAQH